MHFSHHDNNDHSRYDLVANLGQLSSRGHYFQPHYFSPMWCWPLANSSHLGANSLAYIVSLWAMLMSNSMPILVPSTNFSLVVSSIPPPSTTFRLVFDIIFDPRVAMIFTIPLHSRFGKVLCTHIRGRYSSICGPHCANFIAITHSRLHNHPTSN